MGKHQKQLDLDQGLPVDGIMVADPPFVEQFEPTATERRNMLIAGVKDFDAKVKPEPAEEAVDNFLAKPSASPGLGSGSAFRPQPMPTNEPENGFDWAKDSECIVLHEQPATAVYFGGGGHLVIRQTNGFEDDVTILVAPENITAFLEATAKRAREG